MSGQAKLAASETDFLVIGAGLAGLYAALHAARHGTVALISKSLLNVSSSAWAQGGVAAALGPDDSPRLHEADTLEAGRGLCNQRAVEILTREGPECVKELETLGVPFERGEHGLDLGQEGGHSRRRIVHAGGGATGDVIVTALCRSVRETSRISVHESTTVVELLSDDQRCFGVSTWQPETRAPRHFLARSVVLATGGVAGLYYSTTNPPTSIGDGIALAYRAGAEMMDMEFMQFHPTALYSRNGRSFLISEAVRGEGAYLVNAAGRRFVLDHDQRGELAPRDVVAWAIHQEMKKTGTDHVFLSLKHLDPALVRRRFSSIHSSCLEQGLDLAADLIPVAPAAHYTIGGVRSDLDGRTNLGGLWACGEVACTGVHGANRLASNSLLECLVFARRAVEDAAQTAARPGPVPLTRLLQGPPDLSPLESPGQSFQSLAALMTDYVGLLRNERGLQKALAELDRLEELYGAQSLEWRNRLIVSRLMARAALLRRETRGVHRREDFPDSDPAWRNHIVFQKDREPALLPV